MTNHVHVAGIPDHELSLARTMGRAHYDYTIYLNRRRKRSGHLWQNRFFSVPLDRDHVPVALRYVDLNPVRAGLVDGALEYEWSSAVAHVEGLDQWNLLDTKNWREICTRGDWADALRDPIVEADQMMRLRTATQTGRPLGSDEFVKGLETRLKRPTKPRKPGPAKKSGAAAAASGQLR